MPEEGMKELGPKPWEISSQHTGQQPEAIKTTNDISSEFEQKPPAEIIEDVGGAHEMPRVLDSMDPNDIDPRTAQEMAGARSDLFESRSPSIQLINLSESKDRLEKMKSKELEVRYNKFVGDILYEPLTWVNKARTRFGADGYEFKFSKRSADFFRKELFLNSYEENRGGEKGEALRHAILKDTIRLEAFEAMIEHSYPFLFFYFSGTDAMSVLTTGRRLSVLSTDDFRKMYGKLKVPEIKEAKMKKLPESLREGPGERIKNGVSELCHFQLAIANMNRFDPYKENSMKMNIPTTEREFLAELFRITGKGEGDTQKITVNNKTFDINLLSYFTTMETESERKRYESLMMSLVINNAYSRLSELPQEFSEVTGEHDKAYKQLIDDINKTAHQIEDVQDAVDLVTGIPASWKEAKWIHELTFSMNLGTMEINNLAYYRKWKNIEDSDKISSSISIAGPDTAYDTVNAMLRLVHELQYSQKGRVVSPLMGPVDQEFVDDLIFKILDAEGDTNLRREISKSERLSIGAKILGMYEEGNDEIKLSDSADKMFRELTKDKKMNKEVSKFLEKTAIGWKTSYEGAVLPFPVKGVFESAILFEAFVDKENNKTLQDLLDEGKLYTDEEFDSDKYFPFVPDASQVNNKFMQDVLGVLYGKQDARALKEKYGINPVFAITQTIKETDIGTRMENHVLPGEEKPVPKEVYQIVHSAYINIAYLALYEHGILDGDGNWTSLDKDSFLKGFGDKKGVIDYVVAAAGVLPKDKGNFKDFRDTYVRCLLGFSEWFMSVADAAQKQYESEKWAEDKRRTASALKQ